MKYGDDAERALEYPVVASFAEAGQARALLWPPRPDPEARRLRPLPLLVARGAEARLRAFLDSARRDGCALGWTMPLAAPAAESLLFSALALADGYLLVLSRDLDEAARAAERARAETSPSPELDEALELLARRCASARRPEAELSAELGRINAELARMNADLAVSQRELHARNAELARVVSEKNRMLGIAAYDLRGPLAAIATYADLLRAPELEPREGAEFVDEIRGTTRYLLGVVDGLLNYSSIETGVLELRRELVEPHKLAERVLRRLRPLADRKELRLEASLDRALPGLELDPTKTEQALGTLLAEAIRFSPPRGAVLISLERTGEEILLSVEDEGPAPDPADLLAVDSLARGQTASCREGGRVSGLGLAIAAKVMRAQGGALRASPSRGAAAAPGAGDGSRPAGARFVLAFPAGAGA